MSGFGSADLSSFASGVDGMPRRNERSRIMPVRYGGSDIRTVPSPLPMVLVPVDETFAFEAGMMRKG